MPHGRLLIRSNICLSRVKYAMALSIYNPLYVDDRGVATHHKVDNVSNPLGAVVTQVQVMPLFAMLDFINITEMDVFLFTVPHNGSDARLLAVYESAPEDGKRGLTIQNVLPILQPVYYSEIPESTEDNPHGDAVIFIRKLASPESIIC